MGILDNVERGLEKLVRGAFTAGSGSRVQPVEIASALRREMDNQSITLTQGRTLAPNTFTARLSETDFALAQTWGTPLAEELCDVVLRHAASQQYALQGPVRVSFTLDTELKAGSFEVDSSTEEEAASGQASSGGNGSPGTQAQGAPRRDRSNARRLDAQPVLDINGQRYSLSADSVVLGRSPEADIYIDDSGVSRRHLEISTRGSTIYAVDLGSTNGSYVNGQRLHGEIQLADGAAITMGRTRLTFRLLADSTSAGGGPRG
jgi:hypothetical protein